MNIYQYSALTYRKRETKMNFKTIALVWALLSIYFAYKSQTHEYNDDYKKCLATERQCIDTFQIDYYEFNNSKGEIMKFQKNRQICILADLNNLSDYVVQSKSLLDRDYKDCYVGSVRPCYKYSTGDKEPLLRNDCNEYNDNYFQILFVIMMVLPFGYIISQTPS